MTTLARDENYVPIQAHGLTAVTKRFNFSTAGVGSIGTKPAFHVTGLIKYLVCTPVYQTLTSGGVPTLALKDGVGASDANNSYADLTYFAGPGMGFYSSYADSNRMSHGQPNCFMLGTGSGDIGLIISVAALTAGIMDIVVLYEALSDGATVTAA